MRHILSEFDEPRANGFAATAASLYAGLLSLLQPLLLHNGYYDIVETKQAAFLALAGLLLLAIAGYAIRSACRKRAMRSRETLSAADICMLGFVAAAVLGALGSGTSGEALLGANNRYQGIVTMLLYGALWLALTRCLRFGAWELTVMLLGGVLVSGIGVCNRFGLDPLRVWAILPQAQRGSFISTVGNIDFYGAYLSLLLPGLPLLLCRARRPATAIVGAVALVICECGSLSAGSDGAAIACVVASLVTPLLLYDVRSLRRLPLIWFCMLLVLALFLRAGRYAPSALYPSHTVRFLALPAVTGALAAGCLLLYLLSGRMAERSLPRCKRIYGIGLCVAFAFAALALLMCNTCLRGVRLGALDRFVRFGEDWGTGRGRIWRMCVEAYGAFPWWQKLIGGGPGSVLASDLRTHVFSDALVDAAHNEYLHYLLTTGAVGLIAYAGLLLSVARRALCNAEDAITAALLLGTLAYALQAVFGIAQPATTPLFMLLLAALNGRRERRTASWRARSTNCRCTACRRARYGESFASMEENDNSCVDCRDGRH